MIFAVFTYPRGQVIHDLLSIWGDCVWFSLRRPFIKLFCNWRIRHERFLFLQRVVLLVESILVLRCRRKNRKPHVLLHNLVYSSTQTEACFPVIEQLGRFIKSQTEQYDLLSFSIWSCRYLILETSSNCTHNVFSSTMYSVLCRFRAQQPYRWLGIESTLS